MVVPDVEKAATFYRDTFGVQVDKPFTAEAHGVHVAFVYMGNTKIEVDDLRGAVEGIKQKNLRFLAPEPKVGACGLPVIFMHPKDANGVLIELEASHSTEGH
ncbi:methylmalonyl-CoA epimerase [Clonorchis sinensis]|uniref:Methylmalonyl-CoA epimerase n=1 Tax=Clonorchis sinensis TaxID=79923 RepID=G7Y363_CLOSI|nr:methylmalonyl-CoA epimerase [Clonorchis sinensis]